MELLCPLCQKKLTIDDQYAGMVLTCQMCQGQFQAPALPDAPMAAAPSPSPVSVPTPPAYAGGSPAITEGSHKVEEPPPAPKPASASSTVPVAAETVTPEPSRPLPPLADGFNHIYVLNFNQNFLSWVAVVCLGIIFILSFMPWTISGISLGGWESDSMWSITFLVYNIFYFFTLIVAVVALLLDKKIISLPPGMKKMRSWRSLVVACLGVIGLFALLFHWASTLNFRVPNPNTVIFSVVLFLQKLVVVAPLLDFWLQRRKRDDLPIPKIEMRW